MRSSKHTTLAIMATAAVSALSSPKVLAAESQITNVQTSVNNLASNTGAATNLDAQIASIINILIGVIGVAAVIMLIIGGFRYVFSQGDEKSTKGAKDTILYAIIGIVVALLAFAIVNFVLGGLAGSST